MKRPKESQASQKQNQENLRDSHSRHRKDSDEVSSEHISAIEGAISRSAEPETIEEYLAFEEAKDEIRETVSYEQAQLEQEKEGLVQEGKQVIQSANDARSASEWNQAMIEGTIGTHASLDRTLETLAGSAKENADFQKERADDTQHENDASEQNRNDNQEAVQRYLDSLDY